jgi:hypothetical protein
MSLHSPPPFRAPLSPSPAHSPTDSPSQPSSSSAAPNAVLGELLGIASATKKTCCRWRNQHPGEREAHHAVRVGECMDVKSQRQWCHRYLKIYLKLKKSIITNKTSKLNSDRTIGFLTIKTSKQDPTWLYFYKLFYPFLNKVIYSVITRTKRMNC